MSIHRVEELGPYLLDDTHIAVSADDLDRIAIYQFSVPTAATEGRVYRAQIPGGEWLVFIVQRPDSLAPEMLYHPCYLALVVD